MSRDLYHFTTRAVHGDLAPLGIKVHDCRENATYQMREGELWKDIGSIFVYATGQITISHVTDATPREIALLTGHAEQVWRGTVVPTKATAWFFQRRSNRPNYWFTSILVRADALRDETAARIEAARSPQTLADLRWQSHQHSIELSEESA